MATPVRIRQPAPIAGLTTATPADSLDAQQTPGCLNVRFRFGRVQQAPGRDVLSGPVTSDDVLHIGSLSLKDGTTEWPVMLTESKWCRWGGLTPGTPRSWSEVTGSGLTGTGRYSVAMGEDFMFVARASHNVFRWSGTALDTYTTIPDGGTFSGSGLPRARYVEYFNDRLILGWTTEDGADYANRVRWAVNGDHTNWSGTGSGFLDFYEGNAEPIMGVKGLGARCAVYQPHAIVDLIPTGVAAASFSSETRVRGIGTRAPYTIASTGQAHFFLGTDANVYAWDGVKLQRIGDAILDELQGLVYPDQMHTYFGVVSTLRQEYWLVLSDGNVFVYDYAREAWSRDSFPSITALGEVTDSLSNTTWNTATGTWDSTFKSWSEMGGTSAIRLWGGRSDGATFTIDETVNYDYFAIGSIMDRYCETPDWYLPDPQTGQPDPTQTFTLQRMQLVYDHVSDEPFEVGVSTDRGSTWQTQMITPTATGFCFVDWLLSGNHVRFRFREQDALGAFRWRSYSYDFVPGGQYLG